ncbi:MAG: glycosyltransferase, partial [Ignavibacteria bacterium]|nr:glycosyltransferase [Ignavibacteria bacterium]
MKPKILVMASTFPRWKNDTIPPFVYELSKRLVSNFDVYVLAPHFKGAKKYEVMDGMKVYRFQYLPEKFETLAGSGGILPTLKKNKLNYLQIPFFLIAEFFALRKLVREINPNKIHAHWI